MEKAKFKAWLIAIVAGLLLLGAEWFVLYRVSGRTLFRSDLVLVGISMLLVIIVGGLLILKIYKTFKHTLFFGLAIPILMSTILWPQLFATQRFICLKASPGEHGPYIITQSLKPYFFESDYWLVEDKCKAERKTKTWNAPFIPF